MVETSISPKEFSRLNAERCEVAFGLPLHSDRAALYLATSLGEEAGEVLGVIKKMERGFNIREAKKLADKLNADYASLFPEKAGELKYDIDDPEDFKSLHRIWKLKTVAKLAEEMADTINYLDLIATKYNIDIPQAIKNKFNKVSDEMRADYKIP